MFSLNRKIAIAQIIFVVLWSSGFVGAKYGLEYVGVFTFLFLRYALLSLFLLSFSLLLHGTQSISWFCIRQFAVIGILAHGLYLATMWVAFALGATAGSAALIGALQPLLTGIIAQRTFGECVGIRQWSGLLIGTSAIVLIVFNGMAIGGSISAHILLFVGVGCITTASLHQRWMDNCEHGEHLPITINLTVQYTVSAMVLAIPASLLEGTRIIWNIEFLMVLLWLSIAVSLGGFAALWFLVRRCPVTEVSSLVYLTVPVTMIFGYLVFGDTITPVDCVGLAVAAFGVMLVQKKSP